MLHLFRESVGRYIAIGLLGLIGVTFIFFGIDFSITQTSFAAKVNGEKIPIRDFDEELQSVQNDYQRQFPVELTDDLRLALRRETIDRMVGRTVLLQPVHNAGYRVSDARLEAAIREIPQFQVGGVYSEDVAVSLLAAQQITPALFKARQREALEIDEWQSGIVDSAFVTPAEMRRAIELTYERREIAYATFPAANYTEGADAEIEDSAIQQYYSDNATQFETPEMVDVEFVVLELSKIADSIQVTDDQLRQYYEDEAARFASGEERHVRHILFQIDEDNPEAARAAAEAAFERAQAGEDFAMLAAELSQDIPTRNDGGDLGWMARGVLPGAFEDALFAMQPGEIRGPIETEFGYHVIKLEGIRASEQPPFEVVRDQMRDEIATEQAANTFYDTANDLANAAFQAGNDLASVAERFNLPLETMAGLTRTGGRERFANPQPFIAAAFSDEAIASGENSDLIEIDENTVAVLRVVQHHLPQPIPIEDVTDQIRAALVLDMATEKAVDASGAFLDSLDPAAVADGSQDPAMLAEAAGATWTDRFWVDRGTQTLPQAVLSAVISQARPAEGSVQLMRTPLGNGDQSVVILYQVQPGVPEDIPTAQRENDQQNYRMLISETELNGYLSEARQAAKVRIPDEVLNPDQ